MKSSCIKGPFPPGKEKKKDGKLTIILLISQNHEMLMPKFELLVQKFDSFLLQSQF